MKVDLNCLRMTFITSKSACPVVFLHGKINNEDCLKNLSDQGQPISRELCLSE